MRDQFSSTGTVLPIGKGDADTIGQADGLLPFPGQPAIVDADLIGAIAADKGDAVVFYLQLHLLAVLRQRDHLIRRLRQIDAAHHLAVDPYFRGAIGGAAMGQHQPQGAAHHGQGHHCP